MKIFKKTALFVFIFFSFFCSVQCQIRSDYMISAHGSHPRIAVDEKGHLHTTWDYHFVGFLDTYYRRFDSLGYPLTERLILSSNGMDAFPKISVNSQYAMVVWDVQFVAWYALIKGQLLSIEGVPLFDNIVFFEYDHAGFTDVCFLNDSTFVVIWSADKLYGQIATTSLRFIGENIVLNDHETSSAICGQVISHLEKGYFVVIWREYYLGSNQIFGRIFHSDGTPKDSNFLINDDTELTDLWDFSAAINPNGNFGVVWSRSGVQDSVWQIQWRWFGDDGVPLGPSETIVQSADSVRVIEPDMAIDSDGKCIVVWEQVENSLWEIYAQRFISDRTPIGDSYRVPVLTDTLTHFQPSIALHNGNIYTAWTRFGPDTTMQIWANIIDFNHPPVSVGDIHSGEILKSFHLFQNYPNPFNSETVISYTLSKNGHVKLKIYDITGKEVETLLNEVQSVSNHRVVWHCKDDKGGDIPSGIYLCRLSTNDYVETRKMLLVR